MNAPDIREIIRSTYRARVRGDVAATMDAFADDVVFEFNGRGTGAPSLSAPIHGKAALWPTMQSLVDDFLFSDWREIALLVEGDQAVLHWRALVTVVANGKAEEFDVFDKYSFAEGKIAAFHQTTDTAMMMAMISAEKPPASAPEA